MYLLFKRLFDIIFTSIVIILIAPLFILIMIVLRFSGEGEVFYLQERIGYKNKKFYIYKFATMLKNSINMGTGSHTIRNDPRVTKVGKILRMTKINEIPQLFNVLKGDMTLVGPRPLVLKSYEKYSSEVKEVIYNNRPGVTGLGSLIFRDEEYLVSLYKELISDTVEYYDKYVFPYKGKLELWYFKNISLKIDLKILFLTFWAIVNSESSLIEKWFKTIPEKPELLTKNGLKKLKQKSIS